MASGGGPVLETPSGIEVIATLVRKNGAEFPIVSDQDLKGGFRVVADATARDAIPLAFRTSGMYVTTADTNTVYCWQGGELGAWVEAPFRLVLAAGTAVAGTAPLKLTSGTALTATEDGAVEYHAGHVYVTIGSTRYQLDQQSPDLSALLTKLELGISSTTSYAFSTLGNITGNAVVPGEPCLICIESLGNGIVLAGGMDNIQKGWIAKSTNYGATWTVKYSAAGNAGIRPCLSLSHVGNGKVYAGFGTEGRVSVSTDYGETWSAPDYWVGQYHAKSKVVRVSAGVLLIATYSQYAGCAYIRRTTNDGTSYTDVYAGPAGQDIQKLVRLSNGVLLANPSGTNGYVLRSTDDGLTWVLVAGTGQTADYITDFADCGNGVVIYTSISGNHGWRCARSTDYGATWTRITFPGDPANVLGYSAAYCGSGRVIIGGASQLWISTDYGITWVSSSAGLPSGGNVTAVCPTDNNGLLISYAADKIGVMLGNKIKEIFGGTGQVSYAQGDLLYASNTNTLSKLPIGAAGKVLTSGAGIPVWSPITVPMSAIGNLATWQADLGVPRGALTQNWLFTTPRLVGYTAPAPGGGTNPCFVNMGNGIILAGSKDPAGACISKSTDYGVTWTVKYLRGHPRFGVTAFVNMGGGKVLAFITGSSCIYIATSTDYGETFPTEVQYIGYPIVANVIKLSATVLIMAGWNTGNYKILNRSTDAGATWTPCAFTDIASSKDRWGLIDLGGGVLLTSGNNEDGKQVLRSTDSGENWVPINTLCGANDAVQEFCDCGQGIVLAASYGTGKANGARSTDYGATWAQWTVPSDTRFRSVIYVGNGVCLATTDYGALWVSEDKGVSWFDKGVVIPGTLYDPTRTGLFNMGSGKILSTHLYNQVAALDLKAQITLP